MNTKENTVALISDIFKQLFSRDQLFQCALDEANDGKIMTAPVLCLLLVPFETKQTYSFIIFFLSVVKQVISSEGTRGFSVDDVARFLFSFVIVETTFLGKRSCF